jgi:hypothetical protein
MTCRPDPHEGPASATRSGHEGRRSFKLRCPTSPAGRLPPHAGTNPQAQQHVGGFATQMVQTPSRQPVRQIAQRHSQDCATGIERTEARFVRWTITGDCCMAVGVRPGISGCGATSDGELFTCQRSLRQMVRQPWPACPTGMLPLLGPEDCCASAAGRGRDRISAIPPLDGRASRCHLGQQQMAALSG